MRPRARTVFKIFTCRYPISTRRREIVVTAPGGFEWATEPNPTAAALAEYFPWTSPGEGNLYINPEVKSDLAATGSTLPLGGSTGTLIQLSNGVPLAVTIDYQGHASPDTVTVEVSHLVSATDPMPPVSRSGECGRYVSSCERRPGWDRAVL